MREYKTVTRSAVRLGLFLAGLSGLATAQESASFRLARVATVASGGRMDSASYATTVTVSELTGAAARCPMGSAVRLGFWSVLGPGDAPIVLRLGKNPTLQGRVELSWTGQAAGFRVYRSPSPIDVSAPQHFLLGTGSCSTQDVSAPALAFYVVRPMGGVELP